MVESSVNWPNRYGADDSVGAANEITTSVVLEAFRLVKRGERLVLGRVLKDGIPTQMWRFWKHQMTLERILPDNFVGPNRQSFVEETVAGALHSGTHLDSLGHIGIGEYAYNGRLYSDIATGQGLLSLGIDQVPPLITRGVLLNVAALYGVECLPVDHHISAGDLENAARRQDIDVRAGDAVLIHTGWGMHWDLDPVLYASAEPGIGLEGARWLSDHRVSLVGSDNWAVELVPGLTEEGAFAVHQHCIALYGIYLLENVDTTPLLEYGANEFCFMTLPARLAGASGVPVAPVAVI